MTHSGPPASGVRGDVATRGVPLDVVHAIVLGRGKQLDVQALAALLLVGRGRIVRRKVEVPELDVTLGRGLERGEDDLPTPRGPDDAVRRLVFESLEHLEVAFADIELVEHNVVLNRNSRTRVAKVGVIAGDDAETVSLGLPVERSDGVWRRGESTMIPRHA